MKRTSLKNMGWLGIALGLVTACEGRTRSLGDNAGGQTSVTTGGAGGTGGADTSTGGQPGTGGANTSTGGQVGTGANTSPTPYISNPTLPIDPSCTCASSDNICNAAGNCVPRCDSEGRCAMWLTNRSVKDLFVDADTFYYATSAVVDPLGESWYRWCALSRKVSGWHSRIDCEWVWGSDDYRWPVQRSYLP